jgi:hypothetical protein
LTFLEEYLQAVQSLLPELAIPLYPVSNLLHGGWIEVVEFFTPDLAGRNQAGLL